MDIAPVALKAFAREVIYASIALRRPLFLIITLVVVDVVILSWNWEWAWRDAGVAVAAWFFGSGNVPSSVSGIELTCLAIAALLGYTLLGLIVWAMTTVVKKAQL